MKYGIRSIPTLLVFKNGEVVDKLSRSCTKEHDIWKTRSTIGISNSQDNNIIARNDGYFCEPSFFYGFKQRHRTH